MGRQSQILGRDLRLSAHLPVPMRIEPCSGLELPFQGNVSYDGVPQCNARCALSERSAKWAYEPGSVVDDHLSTSVVADAL